MGRVGICKASVRVTVNCIPGPSRGWLTTVIFVVLQGEAPVFNITEDEPNVLMSMFSKGRTNIFKARSIEECCEWAIALREAISEQKPG